MSRSTPCISRIWHTARLKPHMGMCGVPFMNTNSLLPLTNCARKNDEIRNTKKQSPTNLVDALVRGGLGCRRQGAPRYKRTRQRRTRQHRGRARGAQHRRRAGGRGERADRGAGNGQLAGALAQRVPRSCQLSMNALCHERMRQKKLTGRECVCVCANENE